MTYTIEQSGRRLPGRYRLPREVARAIAAQIDARIQGIAAPRKTQNYLVYYTVETWLQDYSVSSCAVFDRLKSEPAERFLARHEFITLPHAA